MPRPGRAWGCLRRARPPRGARDVPPARLRVPGPPHRARVQLVGLGVWKRREIPPGARAQPNASTGFLRCGHAGALEPSKYSEKYSRPSARPCWGWCGRGEPGPGCHPGSVFGNPPTIPCLACGRAFFSCQHPGACCSDQCSGFLRDLRSLPPAETAARWLSADEFVTWEERAAVLFWQSARPLPQVAERRALIRVWHARERGAVLGLEIAVDHARAEPRAAAVATAPIAHACAARTHAEERAVGGQVQLSLFGG